MNKINSSHLRYFRIREEDRQGISMTYMTGIIKIDVDQMVEIGEFHLVVGYNADKSIKISQGMIRTVEVTLGEDI